MTSAERNAIRLDLIEDVVADWWNITVDIQFEDVTFSDKTIQTKRKTDCCVMAYSKTIDSIRTALGMNPRNGI